MTEPDDALSLEMVTAALRADSTDVAVYATVLTKSLSEALPPEYVTVERKQSMSDRMRGRPGEISRVVIRLGDQVMTLAVHSGKPSAEICKEVRGVVLSRQAVPLHQWATTLAGALVVHAESNAQAAAALRRLVLGSLSRCYAQPVACVHTLVAMPALESLPGKIGPYRVVEKIGEGGMGVVYLARNAARQEVALKVLGPAVAGDPSARARLSREVETMRRVRSPYVAEILDADVNCASPYIVTRYVPGRTLDATVKRGGALRGAALARFAYGLAEALAAIHAAGVVHRDLKPGNVMLASDGDPVVIDFGIANTTDGTRLTQTGIVMGTPGYLAPEVIEGEPSSPASDVHSWGTTVAFAATGRQPFGLGTFQSIFFRVLNGQVELDGVPGALMPLLTASLTRNPRNRPSAQWLAAQCSALGAAGLEPTVVDGLLPGPGGTLTGPPDGFEVPRGYGAPTAPPRSSGYAAYGHRAGGALVAAAPASYLPGRGAPGPAEAAGSVADLLPPVDYARAASETRAGGAARDDDWADRLRAERARERESQAGIGRAGRVPAGEQQGQEARPVAGHGLIVLAAGVAAVALAIALPVAGTLLALAVITLLRAADRAEADLSSRRSAYGARASDVVVVIVTAPWRVARAAATTVALAPLAVLVAALAAAASVLVGHTTSLPDAGSWAAGAAVAWTVVGPGSGTPRRQLRRISSSMIRSRGAMAVALVTCWCLAVAAVTSMLSQAPLLWPATTWMLPHLPSLGNALHGIQRWLLRRTVGMLHIP